jgi:tRNA(Ile)-lysidine synthase
VRLTDDLSAVPAGLAGQVHPILDERLRRGADAPLAVALSGGGDSLALALIAADWAAEADRRLLLLTVDHGLNRQSPAWTAACAETARRLGAGFQPLTWDGPKPAAGLAAAARAARHRLLADAARKAGARVILMGHTGSDVLEAEAMRAAGSTTPDPRTWTPSPAWPEGRGVFLLRPLLGLSRAELRDWLAARGERWIEDPANADPGSARAQARLATEAARPKPPAPVETLSVAETCRLDAAGGIHAPRGTPLDPAFVGVAAVCAGGGHQRPSTAKLERLARLLAGPEALTASLAGARIEANAAEVAFYREPGEARRGGLTTAYLVPDLPTVWDGRFELTARRPGLHVQRLEGLARKLSAEAQRALNALPAGARGALPVIVEDGQARCPLLEPVEGVTAESLVGPRLFAACGLVEREPA